MGQDGDTVRPDDTNWPLRLDAPTLRRRGRHARPPRLRYSSEAMIALAIALVMSSTWAVHSGSLRRSASALSRPSRGTRAHVAPSGRSSNRPPAAEGSPAPPPLPNGRAQWVIDENRKPGTHDWLLRGTGHGSIQGYASVVSARRGDPVTLFVSTDATSFHAEAYRIGYYQGMGGRFVWRSPPAPGRVQPPPQISTITNMVEAAWKPALTFEVGRDWTPGDYVLKLVAAKGAQSYVPLTVRDDASHAALVIQNSVTTWQAYNAWGGYSLYHGPSGGGIDRATVVSFDRPYAIGNGAGDLLDGNERTIVSLVEQRGLDVTYWTDVDFHERPRLLLDHRALITLGHDEYWSSAMREGAFRARAAGVNLAFLGANADFRHIRLQPSQVGPDREEVNYRGSPDPLAGVNDAEVTANWRTGPIPRPESELNGAIYECNPVSADMVIEDPSSWIFAHAHLTIGSRLPLLVGSEYDLVQGAYPTPRSIEILAHSPVTCAGHPSYSDMTFYTTQSGAGVFDSGTSLWTTRIGLNCVIRHVCDDEALTLSRITTNILQAFAMGPVGLVHPSAPNVSRFGVVLYHPTDP